MTTITISQQSANFSISKIFEKIKGPSKPKITEMYYIAHFHEDSDKLYIRIIISYKKKQNQEIELKYNRISQSTTFEITTSFDENPEFDHIPRIIELYNYFDTSINKTMYYIGYMFVPRIKPFTMKYFMFLNEINYRNTVIPDILHTVSFLANNDHVINFTKIK